MDRWWNRCQVTPKGSVAAGFQRLLLRVTLWPFFFTMLGLWWFAWGEFLFQRSPFREHISQLCFILIPSAWGWSLWRGLQGALQISRALEDLVDGQAKVPGDFLGLSEHLLLLQASLNEKQRAQAGYQQALQRVELQRSLLQRIASDGTSEVELEDWAESLWQGLESGLAPLSQVLWLEDGLEFYAAAHHGPPGHPESQDWRKRSFLGLGPCWSELDPQGCKLFLRVDPSFEGDSNCKDSALLFGAPQPVALIVELSIATASKELDTADLEERFLSLLPLLSVSWANWCLYGELSARMRMNHHLIESLEDGVLVSDRHGRIVSLNRAAGWILGRTLEQVQNRVLDEFAPLEASPGSWAEAIRQDQVPARLVVRLNRPGQAALDVLLLCSLLQSRWRPSNRLSLTVVLRDITKQRELESLRSDFVATLSHELRTPLTSIKGYLQTLMHPKARSFDIDKIQGIVGVINGQADQLQRLIQELLEAAKIRSQDLEIRPQRTELGELLSECLREHPSTKVCQRLVAEDHCWAWCDPDRVASVVENLLSNAQKYSLPGGLVEVGCCQEQQGARVWIRDEGVGIPEEHQAKIFEMFHRLDNSDQRRHYGVGVGLYLARRVVEGHGGLISVESSPGRGALFSFTLPVSPGESRDSARVGLPESRDGTRTIYSPSSS